MGCFVWFTRKKAKRKARKAVKKAVKQETKRRKEIADDNLVTNLARGGVAFALEISPPKRLNAPPLKPTAGDLLQDARNKALIADIRRREEMLRRGEASREADRRREEYAHQRWLLDKEFREKAREAMLSRQATDNQTRKANLERLERRCFSRVERSMDAMPRVFYEDVEFIEMEVDEEFCGDEPCDSEVNKMDAVVDLAIGCDDFYVAGKSLSPMFPLARHGAYVLLSWPKVSSISL